MKSAQISSMESELQVDLKLLEAAVKLGSFQNDQQAVTTALTEYIERHQPFRMLELEGQIDFDPEWDYKEMRRSKQ